MIAGAADAPRRMSTPTQFCAAALGLELPPPKVAASGARCWLCGGDTAGVGWRQADAVAQTFTQHNCAALPDSDAVCRACVAFTRAETFQALVRARSLPIKITTKDGRPWVQAGWHCYSHLVTGAGSYEAPVPSRVRAILLDPPPPPFALGLNPSGQKHSLFRTRIASSREVFPVHFDERTFVVDRARFARLLDNVEHMGRLGFSRKQTITGRYHPESIRRAGLAVWRTGEAAVRPWRDGEPDLMALAAWTARGPKWFSEHSEEAAA